MSGAVASVGAKAPVGVLPAGAAKAPATGPSLPDAAPLSGAALNDAMSALYVALSQQRQLDLQSGQNQVEGNQKLRDQQLDDERQALARQQANEASSGRGFFSSIGHLLGDATDDAVHLRVTQAFDDAARDAKEAWNSPAFWSDLEKGALFVAKVAAVVGSVAVTAATLGAGAPAIALAALALSAGGAVVCETHCLGSASAYVGLTMEAGGAVLSLGGSLAFSGASEASSTLSTVASAAMATSGGADVVAGGAHIRNGDFAASAQNAGADAEEAKRRGERLDELTGWVLDELKDNDKSHARALQTLQGAMQTNDQTAAIAATISVKG